MTKINTNISVAIATAHLSNLTQERQSVLTSLVSGRRISNAGDDAAGLAVSKRLQSEIRGLETAFKNTSDSISLLQTAIAGMQTSLNISQRIRELAVQTHNGVYTDADRLNIEHEVKSLISELGRISDATKFNQINLLDGSFEKTMRVGNTNNEVVDVAIDGMGVNRHIEGQSYAIGNSLSLLSPLELATGSSVFDSPLITSAEGTTSPVYNASALALGTSNFNAKNSSQGSVISSAIYTEPITYANGTSVFDTPLTSSAVGSSSLDYLLANNATGTSDFNTLDMNTATGSSVLNIPGTFSGTAVNNGDNSLLSNASSMRC